jgi:hypothetical protein
MAFSMWPGAWAAVCISAVAFGEPPLDLTIPPSEHVDITLTPGSSVRVEGQSALKSFSTHATALNFTGSAETPSAEAAQVRNDLSTAFRLGYPFAGEVRIPISGLRSGDENLDEKVAQVFKPASQANLVFRLTRYEVGEADAVTLHGALSLGQHEQPVTVAATVKWTEGTPRFKGRFEVSLAAHGLAAPRFFYFFQADDRLVVQFDLAFRSVAAPALKGAWNIQ